MEEQIMLSVFTDPMMGLSYESEPILDALARRYGERLVIRYVMRVLVRDVSDFMTPAERALPPEQGIPLYCKRLAKIYKSEESIGGLPINMEDFHLFDPEHRSSKPLCLAYKAAQIAAPDWADAFLLNLRHATVLDCRPPFRSPRPGRWKRTSRNQYTSRRRKKLLCSCRRGRRPGSPSP